MEISSKFLPLALFLICLDFIDCDTKFCNDGLGECVDLLQCSDLTALHHGENLINIRFNAEMETDSCHYLQICCEPENILKISPYLAILGDPGDINENESVITESTTQTSHGENCNSTSQVCISSALCASDQETAEVGILSPHSELAKCSNDSQVCCPNTQNIARRKPQNCGLRNKNGIGMKVSNAVDESQFGEFPWMAAIQEIQNDGDVKYICGGSLIDSNVVLTAAHCVNDKIATSLQVRLGEWDTQTSNEILPHSDHEVSQIIVHSNFGPMNAYNDVALLVLKNPAKLLAHINTVCLPPQNYKFNGNCFASGWGVDEFGQTDAYRVNLKKIELPIVQRRDCQRNLENTSLGARFRLHTSFMCAGGEKGVDTCTGDGGSPLVCAVSGREEIYYQAGIVAWGMKCGLENVPGVYANIANFRSWVDQQMTDLGYGTDAYTMK